MANQQLKLDPYSPDKGSPLSQPPDLGKLAKSWNFLTNLRHSQITPPSEAENISVDQRIWSTLSKAYDLPNFNPTQVSFMVMIPVHNDDRCIERFLHSLSVASLPEGANIFMVFASNGCSDRSAGIIENFLDSQGKVVILPRIDIGENEIKQLRAVEGGNITFVHLDLGPANKANATYHVHRLARALQVEYMHNLDADVMVEPFTFAQMWCSASIAFRSPENAMVQGEVTFIQPDGGESEDLKIYYREKEGKSRTKSCIGINLAWRADEFMEKIWERLRYLSAEDTLAHWLVEANGKKLFYGRSNVLVAAQHGFKDAVQSHFRNATAIKGALLKSSSWSRVEQEFLHKKVDESVIYFDNFWKRCAFYMKRDDSASTLIGRFYNRFFHFAAHEIGRLKSIFSTKHKQQVVEWDKTFERF